MAHRLMLRLESRWYAAGSDPLPGRTGTLGRESRRIASLPLFASLRSNMQPEYGPGYGEGRQPCRGSAMGIRDEGRSCCGLEPPLFRQHTPSKRDLLWNETPLARTPLVSLSDSVFV